MERIRNLIKWFGFKKTNWSSGSSHWIPGDGNGDRRLWNKSEERWAFETYADQNSDEKKSRASLTCPQAKSGDLGIAMLDLTFYKESASVTSAWASHTLSCLNQPRNIIHHHQSSVWVSQ
ncbi:hypothetical protein E2542_SST15777 [Spatholobus suberectus]|nr:hypothetical protein E2542_SST15777 [Spatholobus suberectus]